MQITRQLSNNDALTLGYVHTAGREQGFLRDMNLINPVAMDEGLRFAIREGGRTVGAGVVAKILK